MGKPISQARLEVTKTAGFIDYYAENIEKFLEPQTIKTEAKECFVRYEPLGPMYSIMPWNFPVWLPLKCAIPQLLVGNPVLLKPAPCVPSTSFMFEELVHKAGWEKEYKVCLADVTETESIIGSDVI